MKTITNQGRKIIIHGNRPNCLYYYRKALCSGYKVLWTGEHKICLAK